MNKPLSPIAAVILGLLAVALLVAVIVRLTVSATGEGPTVRAKPADARLPQNRPDPHLGGGSH